MAKKYKKNYQHRGKFYTIFLAPFKSGYRKSEKPIWEGYGNDKPWEVFDELTMKYHNECVTIYVEENNLLKELGQYWEGIVIHWEE